MHPTVATEAELLALLPARCHSLITSQLAVPAADLPDAGKMEDLLTIARTRCQATRESSKARKQAERYDTAAWWEYGQVLDRIRTGCPHKGEWGQSLKAIGETKKGDEPNYNRAEEAIKIFREFVTKKEASKVSVARGVEAAPKERRQLQRISRLLCDAARFVGGDPGGIQSDARYVCDPGVCLVPKFLLPRH